MYLIITVSLPTCPFSGARFSLCMFHVFVFIIIRFDDDKHDDIWSPLWNRLKPSAPSSPLADGANGDASVGFVGCFPVDHLDAVYDWTDTEAQSAARAAVSHRGEVGLRVERYSLQRKRRLRGVKALKTRRTVTDGHTWYPESLQVM